MLLFIMGIILFPWQMICITHPLGHKHHPNDGPSPCELHRIAAQQEGEYLLPPMECGNIQSQIYDLQQPQVEKIALNVQLFAILAVVFEFIKLDNHNQPFLFPPAPNCRSAPLLSSHSPRGPPLA